MTDTANDKQTPQDRRLVAIGAVANPYSELTGDEIHAKRDVIAASIRELSTLGRTAAWKDRVEGWAKLVETCDPSNAWYYLVQWAILTGHSA